MKPSLNSGRILLTTLLMLPLAGCESMTAASSLRVEVESYKGPLTKKPELQLAELSGIIQETCRALEDPTFFVKSSKEYSLLADRYRKDLCLDMPFLLNDQAIENFGAVVSLRKAINKLKRKIDRRDKIITELRKQDKPNTTLIDNLQGDKSSVLTWVSDIEAHLDRCTNGTQPGQWLPAPLPDIKVKIQDLPTQQQSIMSDLQQGIMDLNVAKKNMNCSQFVTKTKLHKLTEIGTRMQAEATALAGAMMHEIPRSKFERSKKVSSATILAEYGAQISARAHQISLTITGRNAQKISTNEYLIGAGSTDFPNMYPWFDATYPTGGMYSTYPEKAWYDHDWHADNASRMPAIDRVRAYERLMKNNFWTTVNTVQANGAGKVRMALIKDDIGNWNLKSFAADPSELLKTYTSVALGVGKLGAELATTGKSTALTQFATPAKASDLTREMERARKKTYTRLSDLKKSMEEKKITDKDKITNEMTVILKKHDEMLSSILME